MITGRINQMISIILSSLILLFMLIVYPDYNKNLPSFEVSGENDILKYMVINMKTYSNHSKKNSSPTTIVQTILFKGNIQQVFESNDMGAASFFFSYNNKVETLVTDAFFLNRKLDKLHDANIFEVIKHGENIVIRYYKCKIEYMKKEKSIEIEISTNKNSYFSKNGIKQKDTNKYNTYFFNYFEAQK